MKNIFSIIVLAIASMFLSVTAEIDLDIAISSVIVVTLIGSAVASKMPQGSLFVIPLSDARNVFTKTLVDVYREKVSVMTFLQSFFPAKMSRSKNISIQVKRGRERIAVDVERGTGGNRKTFTKSTEKIFEPPYYKLWMNLNDSELYNVAMGSQDEASFSQLIAEQAENLEEMRDTIIRSYEFQCAQVLETGIVTLEAGTSINFNRKAASLVDKLAGNYWATGSVNPYNDLENACLFLRRTGKAQGGTFNAIMGTNALRDFLANTIVKERADIRNFNIDDIRKPEMTNGATYHGQVTCGSYKVDIWAYPEIFENADGTFTSYVNEDKVVVIPKTPKFILSHALVPQLVSSGGTIPQTGPYLIKDSIDQEEENHKMSIMSAGVAIPVAVDQIYTVRVVAAS